jgi:hypothetical protein
MADETVKVKDFVPIVKILFSQIIDLTVSVLTLRAALMQAKDVPVPAEELKRLHDFFHNDYDPIQKVRTSIDRIAVSTPEDLEVLLRDFQGPIQ